MDTAMFTAVSLYLGPTLPWNRSRTFHSSKAMMAGTVTSLLGGSPVSRTGQRAEEGSGDLNPSPGSALN